MTKINLGKLDSGNYLALLFIFKFMILFFEVLKVQSSVFGRVLMR